MDGRMQAILLLAVAAISIRLGLTDAAFAYIKPSLQPWLVVAGGALAVLGIHGVRRAYQQAPHQNGSDGDRGEPSAAHTEGEHDHAPAVAWLLAAPLLTLLLVAPPPLGSFAAARQGSAPPSMSAASIVELPAPREGAVDLALREYVLRATYDASESLAGVPVRLIGFVTPADDGDGYLLSRFTANCCAADATALSVEVLGDGRREPDTWLEIVGTWQPRPGHEPGTLSVEPPLIVAERVTAVPQPAEPYEY
jgi:uncharacterized repeat protein (TIGR03943 family)